MGIIVGFRADWSPTLHAEIVVLVAGWQHEQQLSSGRRCSAASRAEEARRLELPKRLVLRHRREFYRLLELSAWRPPRAIVVVRLIPDGPGQRRLEKFTIELKVKKIKNINNMRKREKTAESAATRFLTTRESAERLGVTVNALKAWIREQRLPALRTPGGHHRIAESDLIAFQAQLVENTRTPLSTKPRILVVDDDGALLAALQEALAQAHPVALVQTATDGYEALVQVGAFRPDVLVLDIRMPRLDGFEVCRRLKAGRDTAAVRILAMTAYPEGQVRERVLQCGADDFLEKPFPIEVFQARVWALLGRVARH